jgi:hypothetical protein
VVGGATGRIETVDHHVTDLVAADALATLGETIEISTLSDEWGVRVSVDGQVVSGLPLHSIGEVELVVEVADAAQEEIMDDRRAWPECPHHDAGLHPELREGKAIWNCRAGDHQVGHIGHLGEAKISRGAARRRDRKSRRNRALGTAGRTRSARPRSATADSSAVLPVHLRQL